MNVLAKKTLLVLVSSSFIGLNFAKASGAQCSDVFQAEKGVKMSLFRSFQNRKRSKPDQQLQLRSTQEGLIKTRPVLDSDHFYNIKTMEVGIKDQKQSGRCWIFAVLTGIENYFASTGIVMPNVEFSRTFIQFVDLLERSNSHLDQIIALRRNSSRVSNKTIKTRIKPNVGDGGWPEDIVFLIEKYGLVTRAAMPETKNSLNTQELLGELNTYLHERSYVMWNFAETFDVKQKGLRDRIVKGQFENSKKYDNVDLAKATDEQLAALEKMKDDTLLGVMLILEKALGTPPDSFDITLPTEKIVSPEQKIEIKVEKYSPQSFVTDYLQLKLEDFVNISNLRNRPRNKVYQVKYNDMNRSIRRLNLDPVRMMEIIRDSLLKKIPVPFDSNFGPGVNMQTGDIKPGTDSTDGLYPFKKGQKKPRLSLSERDILGQLNTDHETVFYAARQPVGHLIPTDFGVENSWDTVVGDGGNFNASASWVSTEVGGMMVHKSVLTDKEYDTYIHSKAIQLKAENE